MKSKSYVHKMSSVCMSVSFLRVVKLSRIESIVDSIFSIFFLSSSEKSLDPLSFDNPVLLSISSEMYRPLTWNFSSCSSESSFTSLLGSKE